MKKQFVLGVTISPENPQRAGWAEDDGDGNLLFVNQELIVEFIAIGDRQGPFRKNTTVPSPIRFVVLHLSYGPPRQGTGKNEPDVLLVQPPGQFKSLPDG